MIRYNMHIHSVEHLPHALCSHCSCTVVQYCNTLRQFYDLMTLSNIELELAQSPQHTIVLKEWVWLINHRHAEQKMHNL